MQGRAGLWWEDELLRVNQRTRSHMALRSADFGASVLDKDDSRR